MRIIDPHVHVWINDPAFPWPAENPNPPAEDHTAEDLLALMDANGVEKTVLVQVIHYRWDNSYVAHVIKQYPDRFMGGGAHQSRRPGRGRPCLDVDGGTRFARDAAVAVAGCGRVIGLRGRGWTRFSPALRIWGSRC